MGPCPSLPQAAGPGTFPPELQVIFSGVGPRMPIHASRQLCLRDRCYGVYSAPVAGIKAIVYYLLGDNNSEASLKLHV